MDTADYDRRILFKDAVSTGLFPFSFKIEFPFYNSGTLFILFSLISRSKYDHEKIV